MPTSFAKRSTGQLACDRQVFVPTLLQILGEVKPVVERNIGDRNRAAGAGMWSIAEYADHVRETTFGMRLSLDVALEGGEVDLGDHSTPIRRPRRKRRKDAGNGDRSAGSAEQATDHPHWEVR